jgi:8-oxo-dGTP diphosphatase
MEHGESPQDCCMREVYEETGLTIQTPLLRAVHTVIDVAYPVHWLLFIFRADESSGEFQQSAEGELRWIALAELETYERPFTDLQHWPHVLETTPGIWQGKVVYDTPAQLVSNIRYD